MLKRFCAYLIISIFFLLRLNSQNGITGNPDWQIKPAISKGFIMVHRISIGHLVKGYPTNYEINISKPTLGNKLWHLENNKPDIGISFQCLDFANPSQLGYALTASPFIEIPLNEKEKWSRLVLRICWGATYVTKAFDVKENHKNIAIGSHWNSFIQFGWAWHFRISDRIRFEPGFRFTHASNGKAKNPNLGLNVLSVNAAFNFLIPSNKPKVISQVDSSSKVRSRHEVTIGAAVGFNQRNIGSAGLRTYVTSVAYHRNVRNTHKFGAGVDLYYDDLYQLDYEKIKSDTARGFDKYRIAAKFCYSYNVGRISFPVELGYYVFQKANPDSKLVTRLGVRYYTSSGLIASFSLRTHFAVAYAFEYGLGYRIYL